MPVPTSTTGSAPSATSVSIEDASELLAADLDVVRPLYVRTEVAHASSTVGGRRAAPSWRSNVISTRGRRMSVEARLTWRRILPTIGRDVRGRRPAHRWRRACHLRRRTSRRRARRPSSSRRPARRRGCVRCGRGSAARKRSTSNGSHIDQSPARLRTATAPISARARDPGRQAAPHSDAREKPCAARSSALRTEGSPRADSACCSATSTSASLAADEPCALLSLGWRANLEEDRGHRRGCRRRLRGSPRAVRPRVRARR